MLDKKLIMTVILFQLVLLLCGQAFETIEKDITLVELENGLKLIMLPRNDVPIINTITFANVGSVKEEAGKTGISHFLEHLAFKGTETVGTNDFKKEKKALDKCHKIFDKILTGRAKNISHKKMQKLEKELESAITEANKYAVDNEFSRILEQNGGSGLNAATSYDMTFYMLSLPSNKLELWMLMEADRFTNPVFREFYSEKEVILEEKRMGDSSPMRKFMNDFLNFAFTEHPYRNQIIGTEEDIRSLRVADIEDYFTKHYGAQNLVCTIIGDIDIDETIGLAEKYLAKIPSGVKSPPVTIKEPKQQEERYFSSRATAQPYFLIAYMLPPQIHPDYPIYEVIADLLGQGRSSRLYKVLVEEKKLAVSAFAFSGFPGRIYDNLFVIGVIPASGVGLDECLAVLDEELFLLGQSIVSEIELEGVKKRAYKDSINRLKSGTGLGVQLAYYESLAGGYAELFKELEKTINVSSEDIMRVAGELFIKQNRIIGELKTEGGKDE